MEKLLKKNKNIREQNKVKHFAFIFFTSALAIVYFALMLPPKETITVQGTAMHLSAVADEKLGDFAKLFVKLDDGEEVTASISRDFPFKAGAKVEVLREKSYLGFSSYSVIWNKQ